MNVEFRLLGDVAMLLDGDPVVMGGHRQRSVLALLALQRDRPITAALLADRLWPDEQPLSAIKTVQVYVARIRRALGEEARRISSTASGYRLALADDELDAARFESVLRQAREALATGSSDGALTMLDQALAEWSGPALGDLAGEPFARREAGRLEELRLQAIEELFEVRIAAGFGRETIGELRRLVADQPGRERLWRLLMLALYDDGRQSEALEAYQAARRYLADELGLDPSPDLQELERAILTQEAPRSKRNALVPSLHPGSDRTAAPLVRRSRRVVTVLRADLVASDAPVDPENREAREIRAMEVVRRAVERHGGILGATDPDGVTSVFGLTVAREDDALRAIRAAVELTDRGPSADDHKLVLRVGVATGEVLTGPFEPDRPMLTGASLEVATSLAGHAGPHDILLAAETAQLLGEAVSTEQVSRSGDDATAPSSVRLLSLTGGETIVRRTTTPFVGRAAELSGLLEVFERVSSDGTPGLATVIGAPGVGKSRLAAEAFARMAERATVLRSRCLPYGDGITFWPVRELVQGASGIAPDDSMDEASSKLNAVLANVDGGTVAANRIASVIGLGDVVGSAEEIPWAVRRLFEALAAERPLVILVDDLQWAEPALIDLLEHILDLGRGPILVVTIARPELEDRRADWLARSNLFRLDALDEHDAAELLDRLVPDVPAGQARRRILAAAEGNPLFVEQYVAYLRDTLEDKGSGQDIPTATDLSIPPTIAALLAARLDHLPDTERLLLARAAVIGRTFWSTALSDLVPSGERGDLPRRLAQLARRGLIRTERSVFPEDEAYRFRHLLIRDAAYASLLKRERAELHEQFADWLENRVTATHGAYDLILGYHLEQAYRYRGELGDDGRHARLLAERALAFITPAGQAGEERGDTHATISLLRRALDLSPPTRQRIELLISLGATLQAAGDDEAFEAVDRDVRALLAEHPDEGLAHRRWLTQAMYNAGLGDIKAGEAQIAFKYYERVGDRMGMIHALEVAVMHPDPVSDAVARLDEAIALAFEIGRPDRAASISARSAWIFPYSPVPVPEGLTRLRRSLEWAGTNGFARAMILVNLGELEAMDDRGGYWRAAGSMRPKPSSTTWACCSRWESSAIPRSSAWPSCPPVSHTGSWICCRNAVRRWSAGATHLVSPRSRRRRLGCSSPSGGSTKWSTTHGGGETSPQQTIWTRRGAGGLPLRGCDPFRIGMRRRSVWLVRRWRSSSTATWLSCASRETSSSRKHSEGLGTPAALAAAHESKRLAAEKQNRAALRKVTAFLNAGR